MVSDLTEPTAEWPLKTGGHASDVSVGTGKYFNRELRSSYGKIGRIYPSLRSRKAS